MNAIRDLPPIPDSMQRLPRDKRGFPVPAFVAWMDGEPDFRIIKPGWFKQAIKENLCWLCGCRLGKRKWFVIGPMCAATRTTSEPPCHRMCALFAVAACPFLTRPLAKRDEKDLPENHVLPPGTAIMRNPGCVAIWETETYTPFRADDGVLIELGEPNRVEFWREARPATRAEVIESVKGGLPLLVDSAMSEGAEAVHALSGVMQKFYIEIVDKYLPIGAADAKLA